MAKFWLVLCLALLGEVAAFRKKNTNQDVDVGSAIAKTKDVANKTKSKYKYVQQVGLSLYTFPGDFLNGRAPAFYTGLDKNVEAHRLEDVNNMEDARRRVDLMVKMMETAYNSENYDRDVSVLKIFMAPEFFFRGPYGAYNMLNMEGCSEEQIAASLTKQTCNAPIIEIIQSLRKEVANGKWKDWLFVFGTIVSYVPSKFDTAQKYYNFAPVMRGGPENTMNHHVIAKTFVSHIDFLDCVTHKSANKATSKFCVDNPHTEKGDNLYAATFSHEQQDYLRDHGIFFQQENQFITDDIHFGLEVCLDHAKEELDKHLGDSYVQVHLVTSAGMSVQWIAAGSERMGPIFLQDGGAQGAHTQYFCGDCQYRDAEEGYAPMDVVQSPQDHYFSKAERESFQHLEGTTFSTNRDKDVWYSTRGYATEGTGYGLDPRFGTGEINELFATDNYHPQINFSPAFLVPDM